MNTKEPQAVNKLFTVPEVAEILRLSERSVFTLVRDYKLSWTRVGQHGVRFTPAQVEKYIAENARSGKSPAKSAAPSPAESAPTSTGVKYLLPPNERGNRQ